MDKDKKICKCKKVTYGDVLVAMDKGAKSYKDVEKATGAGSKCGDCKKDIKKLMKKQENKGKIKKDEKAGKKKKKN
ncbi:MAG: (2Fe-2S)-binding protein [Anaerovoracaceae bacterium]|jgi:bacterioferritin-associated ferredoxin